MKPTHPADVDGPWERQRSKSRLSQSDLTSTSSAPVQSRKLLLDGPKKWGFLVFTLVFVIAYIVYVQIIDAEDADGAPRSSYKSSKSRDPFEADSAHCPAMYTGPGCRQEKFLPDCTGTVKPFQGYLTMTVGNPWPGIDDETRAMLPERDVFGRPPGSRAAIPSCALVSNGNMIKGKGLGREIDSHNLVMRINNAPVTGYEHDVGARTDVRFSNANYEGWRETPTEAVIAEHWNILEWERAAGDMRNFTAAAGAQLKRVLAKKVHPLNHEIYNTLASSHFFHDERDTHVTGGFVAMLVLMHACEKVHLYGFNTQQSLREQGYSALKNWYFDKRGNDGGKPIPITKWARWEDKPFPKWNYYTGPLRVASARSSKGRKLQGSQQPGATGEFGAGAAIAPAFGAGALPGDGAAGGVAAAAASGGQRRLQKWHDPDGELMCMMKLRSQGFIEMSPDPAGRR